MTNENFTDLMVVVFILMLIGFCGYIATGIQYKFF